MPTIDNRSTNDYYLDYSILKKEDTDILKTAVAGMSKVVAAPTRNIKIQCFVCSCRTSPEH